MRGFLALEPDSTTQEALRERQNRLRDAMTRQGVSFPGRLHVLLLTWPFASNEELDEVGRRLEPGRLDLHLLPLAGFPQEDRPAEVGQALTGVEGFQSLAWSALKTLLDPDPPKAPLVRLVRVSPPSRKVAAALRGSGLLGTGEGPFLAESFSVYRQTAQGFEICRTIPLKDGGS